MTVFDIFGPAMCFVSHFLCAVTNVAELLVEPFDVIVGCNAFEGVAANYRCAMLLFILWVAVRSNYVSKRGLPKQIIVADT